MSQDTDTPWESEEWLRQKHSDERMTIQEIADYADTTYDTVRYYMRKYDVERHGNSRPDAKYKDADYLREKYWGEGMSLNEIGDDCDSNSVTILGWMKRHDIPRRRPDQEKGAEWKDEDRLSALYWDKGLTLKEIGDCLGCNKSTIMNWMRRFDINRIPTPEEKPASYGTNTNGYERVRSKHNGEERSARVHQLVAIADGADAEKVFSNGEYNVHHRNGIPWDNRPDNIELLTKSEHSSRHYEEREHAPNGDFIA